MNYLMTTIDRVLRAFLAKYHPSLSSRGLHCVPANADDGWNAAPGEWRTQSRMILNDLAAELGPDYSASWSAEIVDTYARRPLADFAHYLYRSVARSDDGLVTGVAASPVGAVDPDDLQRTSVASAGNAPSRSSGDIQERRDYRVWFGTNRHPNDKLDISLGFSSDRAERVTYGYCDVHVPKSHQIGSIGSSALRRLLTWSDDRLRVTTIAEKAVEDFWAAISSQLAAADAGRRHAVVFVHGYNVPFQASALRAAQIGYDLGIEAMAFFSWPSKGTKRGYLADGSTIDASEVAIGDFLIDFARKSGAEAVHVIAHSMGNRGVMRAVSRLAQQANERATKPFGQFVLAAADVDSAVFKSNAAAYPLLAERTTLYISSRDRPLELSGYVADFPRIGLHPPIGLAPDIDTVSVSEIDLSSLGHGYVAEQRAVLSDLHQLFFEGLAPDLRFSLQREHTEDNDVYWSIKR